MTERSNRLVRKYQEVHGRSLLDSEAPRANEASKLERDPSIDHWFAGGRLGRCGVQKEVCRGR